MAIRTTDADVSAIIEVDASISLTPFITAASALVDEIEEDSSCTHDSTRLTLIETWLSAHFYAIRDPRPVSERAGPVSATYQSKVDLNLYLTHYGQMAMTLDTDGLLRSMSRSKRRVSATWMASKLETDRRPDDE